MIVYGCNVSSDIDFPGELSSEAKALYKVELCSSPPKALKDAISCEVPLFVSHGRRISLSFDQVIEKAQAAQVWCFDVAGLMQFYWSNHSRTIYYELNPQFDVKLLSFWFIHQMLPMYLTLEGKYNFIHAGAVEVDGKPILFIAPSMGGKSTLTAYFVKQGHALVSDDKVATFFEDDIAMTVPSHPYYRPFREFEVLGIKAENTASRFKPVHAIYVLEKCDPECDTTIEEIKGFEKFNLLQDSYLYHIAFLKPKQLEHFGNLLNKTRVFKVKRPWNMEKIDNVYHAICGHSRTIS